MGDYSFDKEIKSNNVIHEGKQSYFYTFNIYQLTHLKYALLKKKL